MEYNINNYGILRCNAVSREGLAYIFRRASESSQDQDALLFVQGICFAVFFRNHTTYVFDSHSSRNSAGLQTAAGSSILLTFLSYEDVSMQIHQCYLDNVDNTDREEPFELQFVKVSPAQFVSESLKYNVLRSLKGKYVSNTIQSSVSNPVGKSFEKHSSSALSAIEIDMQLSTSSPIKK